MRFGLALLGAAAVLSLSAAGAGAATLTTSYTTWAANAGAAQLNTQVTGEYTPLNPLATVSTVNLPNGTIGLSDTFTAVVRSPADPFGQFPFALSNGFTGDLFLPSGSSLTFSLPNSISALGFYVATYSNQQIPATSYTITVTLAGGQSQTFSTSGGNLNTGVTPDGFFGYYGGPISSLTITDTDPQGFVVGDFFSVPEPASIALVLVGIAGLARTRRRVA